jgi:hypothetical protein
MSTPKVKRLRRARYQVAPGESAAISLSIPARARPAFRKVMALDKPYHGVSHSFGILVRVTDASGLTLPTGATVCLRPKVKGLPCAYSG